LKYWKLEPYAGFGADAHSFDGRLRYQNAKTVPEYVEQAPGLSGLRPFETARLDEERFFVGLRLTAGMRPEPEEWVRFDEPIRRFVDSGLLEASGGILRLTNRGVLLSNEVFQEFIGL